MADNEVTGWVGWGWFAGIVLLIAGVFNALYGLTAIIDSRRARTSSRSRADGIVSSTSPGWGWWHLIAGIALILVAGALF